MDEDEKQDVRQEIEDEEEAKEDCQLELRAMELKAYSSIMDALRAEGSLDKEKRGLMDHCKKYFDISDTRYIAECRRVNSTGKICDMAERLQNIESDHADLWKTEGYATFPTLPPFFRRLSAGTGGRDPFPKVDFSPVTITRRMSSAALVSTKSDSFSLKFGGGARELDSASYKWNNRVKKVNKKVQTKVSIKNSKIKSEVELSSDEEAESRGRSPDIVSLSKSNFARGVNTRTTRGPKRRLSMERIPINRYVAPPVKIAKKGTNKSKAAKKKAAAAAAAAAAKGKFPKIKFVKRRQETPPQSSDDDDEIKELNNDDGQLSSSQGPQLVSARGRALKSRGSGSSGGGARSNASLSSRGRGGRRKMSLNPNMMGYHKNDMMANRSDSGPNKTLKPKKTKPVSLSRRKSRLKEKEDDEMQVEWNDDDDEFYENDAAIISNKHVPIKKRKHFSDQGYHHHHHPHHYDSSDQYLENGESQNNKETLLIGGRGGHQYLSPPSNNDMYNARGGDGGSFHKSPQLSGEETDSASEKGSTTGSRTNDSPGNNSTASSPPPSRQKQRLKTPLSGANSQLPRVSIPPPVFSTSLSNVQKKRPNKHISVVDSLNLHLPTTPTASSLASSVRRPGALGTGSSIFANSQAILARASGGPGILQQQRKATPHILSNSKVIQRSSLVPLPTTSSNNNNSSNNGSAINPGNPQITGICPTVTGNINMSSNNSILTNSGVIVSSASVIQIPNSGNLNPTMTSRGPAQTGPGPIIFVQKTNSPNNVPISTTSIGSLPSNNMSAPSRAVILRRTAQMPQGNVMILDVPKNAVPNQMPSFIQPVTRIMTAPSDLGTQQRSVIQKITTTGYPESAVICSLPITTSADSPIKGSQIIFTTHENVTYQNSLNQMGQMQLQMETGDIVYEEEVVTSEAESIVDRHPNNNGPQFHHIATKDNNLYYESRSPNINLVAGISSSNNYCRSPTKGNPQNSSIEITLNRPQDVIQMSNAINTINRAIVSSSRNEPNAESSENHQDDIFQAALKSSGIVFTEQFFEEMPEDNSQLASVEMANHVIIENQENGSSIP